MMKGYVTWIGVAGLVLSAAYDLYQGDVDSAMTKFASAIGLLGIGRKADRAAQ